MPLYGTREFEQTEVMMYLRKSFLRDGFFESTVLAIAHELCHIVLDGIAHPLRRSEEAVDLTAMLLGFRDFYVTGCHITRRAPRQMTELHVSYTISTELRCGYLSPEEVKYAAIYMTFH
jgi:hypothetical protein